MKSFNVIVYDFNGNKFIPYDVMPYLLKEYIDNTKYLEEGNEPNEYYWPIKTFEDYKKFVERRSLYQWWGRCEYEIILKDWPSGTHEEKWDVYKQLMMNIDLVAETLMYNINEKTD